MSRGKRIRDIAIETLIAIVLVSPYVAYLFTRPKGSSLDWPRVPLIINTAIVFGFLVSWFRQVWRSSLFWIVVALLMVGHLLAYIFLLRHIQPWPLAYCAVVNVIELVLFTRILSKLPGPMRVESE